MIRLVPFVLYLWLVGLHQVFLSDLTSVYGVTINLPVLMVLLVSVYKSELESCWFGFVVGLVMQAGLASSMGWYALLMAAIGFLAYHVRIRINLENLYSRVAIVFFGVLIYNATVLILGGYAGWAYFLLTQALPGAVYTALIGWVYFLIKDGAITFRKLKAIF